MVDNEIKTWLYDIFQSIKEIESYYENRPRKFEEYLSDIKTKRAIERNIEIIGEATNRILKKDKNFNLKNARKIVGTRNRIIHGYDKISDNLVWSIVINDLSKLKEEVSILLDSNNDK
ncbi:MAG: HepT-like ribonuclease domain-containing protein [Chitinophagales bacterium]